MSTKEHQTCAELVQHSFESRTDDLHRLFKAQCDASGAEDGYAVGGNAVCSDCIDDALAEKQRTEPPDQNLSRPFTCTSCNADIPDEDGGIEDLGNLYEYGLSFDYVAPGTFGDQPEGYARFQISWGGPSEEYRFYVGPGFELQRAEFWYLDWFDGAPITCTQNETVREVYEWFRQAGAVETEYQKACKE